MISKKMEKALNQQIVLEGYASFLYLSMATWCGNEGLDGCEKFMQRQSEEERMHMLKLVKFVNERGGHAQITSLEKPPMSFGSFKEMFQSLFDHEVMVSQKINDLVDITLKEKDYATHNFLQWYVAEQIEEEALARNILDKINLIGDDKGGLYLFDNDVKLLVGNQPPQ